MSEPHKTVAASVRAEMARKQISQQKLAGMLGVAQQTLSRRMTGEVPFDVKELALIAAALDVPVTRFFAPERAA